MENCVIDVPNANDRNMTMSSINKCMSVESQWMGHLQACVAVENFWHAHAVEGSDGSFVQVNC